MPALIPRRLAPRRRLTLLALLALYGCGPNAAIAPAPAPGPAAPSGEPWRTEEEIAARLPKLWATYGRAT